MKKFAPLPPPNLTTPDEIRQWMMKTTMTINRPVLDNTIDTVDLSFSDTYDKEELIALRDKVGSLIDLLKN